jgi:hypothetical protein
MEMASLPIPLVDDFQMTSREEQIIKYRIYQKAAFVEEFLAVGRIYAEADLDRSEFRLYADTGHGFSDAMWQDAVAFFLAIITGRAA